MKIFVTPLILFIFFSCATLTASTVEWTGNISSDWHIPGNWDCNCLPTADDDVLIGINQEVSLGALAPVVIRSLQSRGTLNIQTGGRLEIDGQATTTNAGLQIFNGTFTNQGSLVVRNHNASSSLSVGGSAMFENYGEVLLRDAVCTTGSCTAYDVIDLDGIFINHGDFSVRNVQQMDGVSVRESFVNHGVFSLDSIQGDNLNVFRISDAGSFENTSSGFFELSNIVGLTGINRCFGNVQNNVSVINDGDMVLSNLSDNIWAMDLKGTQTVLTNTGSISIGGGEFALLLQNEAVLINEGLFQCSGQADAGLSISSGANATNFGTITMHEAGTSVAVDLNTQNDALGLRNTGTIVVDDYLNASESARGIYLFSGLLENQGELSIQGAGAGNGIQCGESSNFSNSGTVSLDALTFGLWLETPSGNTGAIHFGPDITEAPITNTTMAFLENSATIGGFGEFASAQFSFTPGTTLLPGTDTQTTSLIFSDALLLPDETTISLDIAATDANPTAYDRIFAQEEIAFSGELNVSLFEGFNSSAGSFVLLESAVALSGNPIVNLPPAPAGAEWRVEQNSTSIVLYLDQINNVIHPQKNRATLHPNPGRVSSLVHWKGEAMITGEIDFKLYGADGRCLAHRVGQGPRVALTFSELPAGSYWLRWTSPRAAGVHRLVLHP